MSLEQINQPNDIKKIPPEEYDKLAFEIREFIVESVSNTGGHLASNLGTVELTMALHLALNLPKDKIVWDVGHQAYTHKILTGRKKEFTGLRQYGGMSGFPKRHESEYDCFDTGHSSTSISAGLGLAKARDLQGEDYTVVSVIGDGSMTGGMVYEAINNAGRMNTNFIIVLNDNNMSISENVGGLSKHLNNIRLASSYNNLKDGVSSTLSSIPLVGTGLKNTVSRTKSGMKQFLMDGNDTMMFEEMGVKYIGPVDGHNIPQLIKILKEAKKYKGAVMIHAMTTKGKGYRPAQMNPSSYHGVEPFEIVTGKPKNARSSASYTEVFSNKLCAIAEERKDLVAITAAMADGTGLKKFSKNFKKQFFDVGIAEEHAVTFAAGLAAGGLKPVVAIYSSFLQRAYDQIIHDVCIQNLPVVFAIDRAGIVGCDGETHQGIFDLSFLCNIPNMVVCAPKNKYELMDMLTYAINYDGPIAIRYPRGEAYRGYKEVEAPIELGKAELLFKGDEGTKVALLPLGSMVKPAIEAAQMCACKPAVINMRFAAPIDEEMILDIAKNYDVICPMEEGILAGGFCEKVEALLVRNGYKGIVHSFGVPKEFVEHGKAELLLDHLGLSAEKIYEAVKEYAQE